MLDMNENGASQTPYLIMKLCIEMKGLGREDVVKRINLLKWVYWRTLIGAFLLSSVFLCSIVILKNILMVITTGFFAVLSFWAFIRARVEKNKLEKFATMVEWI